MITSLLRFLGLVAVLVVAAWLVRESSQSPGVLQFEWQGTQVETSVTFGLMVLALFGMAAYSLGQIFSWLGRVPQRLKESRSHKKWHKQDAALCEAMTHLALGDTTQAKKIVTKIQKDLPYSKVAQVLAAQAGASSSELHRLVEDKATATVAQLELLQAAKNRQDVESQREHADVLLKTHKTAPKVVLSALESRLKAGDFSAAEALLPQVKKAQALLEDEVLNLHACLVLQQAQAVREDDAAKAIKLAQRGLKAHAQFVPLAMFQAATLAHMGKHGPAEKVLAAFYKNCPRLDVFSRWFDFVETSPAYKNTAKRQARAEKVIESIMETAPAIGLLCRAEMFLLLHDADNARLMLQQAASKYGENQALCTLFARLERKENNPAAAAEWLQKRSAVPEVLQAGDEAIAAYQAFRQAYELQAVVKPVQRTQKPLQLG